MDLFKNLGFGGETKQKQINELESFKSRFTPSGVAKTKMPTITPGPMSLYKPPGTSSGIATPQNTMTKTTAAPAPVATPSPYYQAAAALNNPKNNPASTNIKIDETIKSDALNTTPSATTLNEKRKAAERRVLESKFAKEEEKLLQDIASLRTGIAGLQATQDREMLTAESNPTGQLRGGLTSDLSRLNREQAIELNARTGQLNAYLDNLELYQGYRPQMIGNPIIDETTGEAFSYLQDPMTGEIFTESLGQVMTPKPVNPYENYVSLSEGESLIDPATGEVVYKNPKTYAPSSSGSGFSGTGLMFTPEQSAAINWSDPNVISKLPVSDLTKAVMSGTGSMKDLTPTIKAEVLQEMYAVGFRPDQVINNKLQNLVSLWEAMPEDQKGYIQGRKFWATSTVDSVSRFNSARQVLTRELARLKDVGVLSDYDVKSYEDAMPSRTDKDINVVKAKLEGLSAATTGKNTAISTGPQPGSTIRLQDGRYAKVAPNGDLIDPATGKLLQ